MVDWDVFRREADLFNVEYELTKFDESTVKTYRETIKSLRKHLLAPFILSFSTNRIGRRLFIPKENARQRAVTDGMNTAFAESIGIFMDADKFAKDPCEILKTLANKIKLRRRELDIARKQFNEKKQKLFTMKCSSPSKLSG